MSVCLSEFALDDVIVNGQASPEVDAHLRDCQPCRTRHEARRAFQREFERTLATPLLHQVMRQHDHQVGRQWLWLAIPGALAMASTLLFFFARAEGPRSENYLGAKGAAHLEIHCRRGERTFALASGDAVQAGDELRFVPRSPSSQARFIQVASIDGSGTYTPFFPPTLEGVSLPLPPVGQPLEGSIRLDSAPGPERLFFVFSSKPLPAAAVREAAQAQVSGLKSVRSIRGVEVLSSWVLLSKTAAPSSPRPW